MPWVKLDDGYYDNAKIVASDFDGAGLYAMCLSICGRHLTDGFVADSWLRRIGAPKRIIKKVTDANLWRRQGNGYYIPDYLDANPSRVEVLAGRKKEAERKRLERLKKAGLSVQDSDLDSTPESTQDGTPESTPESEHPSPSHETPTPKRKVSGDGRSEETGAAAPATPNGAGPLIDRMRTLVHRDWDSYPDPDVLRDELTDRGLPAETAAELVEAERIARQAT